MKVRNLLKLIKATLLDSFMRATVWVFLGTGILSIGNYLYHVIMGRMLGPSEYGVLESIISFSYILSVPLLTLNLIIVKYVSSYKGKNDYTSISSFYAFLIQRFLREGVVICLILILLSPFITSFLHLSSYSYSILLVLFVFTGLFSGLGRGVLQGMSNFFGLAVSNIVEATSKLFIAILLVFIGLKAQGGIIGIVISSVLAFIAAYLFLSKIRVKNVKSFSDHKLIGKYTFPTFFTTLALTSLFTSDVLLARHFLPAQTAGYYAALSVLGKVVYFAVSPISLVMFPFVSERHAKGEKYTNILLISLSLTFLGSFSVVGIYYLFPELAVLSLFGRHFISISSYVANFGIFIALYSLCFLLANFFLSIHRMVATYMVVVAAVVQIILLYFFHYGIGQMISINIGITFLLLISLLLYYANEFYKARRI